jgi:hypothetical protein
MSNQNGEKSEYNLRTETPTQQKTRQRILHRRPPHRVILEPRLPHHVAVRHFLPSKMIGWFIVAAILRNSSAMYGLRDYVFVPAAENRRR